MADGTATSSTGGNVAEDDPVEEIVTALGTVIAAQRRRLARVWRDRSVSKLNLHLLMLLGAREPQSMGELADQAGVSLPSLTGTITRMEERGLVRRVPCQEDRRKVLVRLSAKGRDILDQTERVRRAEVRRLLGRLSREERVMCHRAMRAMARAATEIETTDA
jgi:DNA-binding MarR family transcriptional regulator